MEDFAPWQHFSLGVEIPNRVFVGGLPYNMTELQLKEFFSQFGSVRDCKIITDRAGLSKGYGFVTFESEEEATQVFMMGSLFYREKKLNVAKAVRRHGGQYTKANQEYVNGVSQMYWPPVSGTSMPLPQGGVWYIEPQLNLCDQWIYATQTAYGHVGAQVNFPYYSMPAFNCHTIGVGSLLHRQQAPDTHTPPQSTMPHPPDFKSFNPHYPTKPIPLKPLPHNHCSSHSNEATVSLGIQGHCPSTQPLPQPLQQYST